MLGGAGLIAVDSGDVRQSNTFATARP